MRWLPYSFSRYLRTSSRKWGAMEGGSRRMCSPRGSLFAAVACSAVTYFSSAIRSRAWLRRCCARAGGKGGGGRPGHSPEVDPDVLPEGGVLHRHDRVAEHGRDVLEAHHHPLLYGELSKHGTVGREDLGDDVRLEVLEGGDLGEVALEGEEDAEQGAPEDRGGEERGDDGPLDGEAAKNGKRSGAGWLHI